MEKQSSILSLEELFNEAKKAHRYALPMPRAKAKTISPDDTEFFLRRAEAELKEERFPLRGHLPPGRLHFPAPAREQHAEGQSFWSCAWTIEGVVTSLRAGAFFVSGHHDFAERGVGQLALGSSRESVREAIRKAPSFETALHIALESRARPSRLDPDELLSELMVQPSQGEVL